MAIKSAHPNFLCQDRLLSLSHQYRPDIDGLRAIAVLAVVGFHLFPERIPGGFIGVDIFFVISGYLISSILFQELNQGAFSLSNFYARRIRRIFPALCLILIASLIAGWFLLSPDEYKQLGKHVLAGAGFVANIVYWTESGYFDVHADVKPLLHLWSLGVEEQFYIIWPLALWFFYKKRFNLFTLTLAIALCSFALNLFLAHTYISADFYLPLPRFWELLCGSALAWITFNLPHKQPHSYQWSKYLNSLKAIAPIISIIGLTLIGYGFFGLDKSVAFPGAWALIPVIGTALLIAAGSDSVVNKLILSNKIAVWIGLISYPLYLWHWPLLAFARIYEGEFPSRNIRIAIVLLSLVLAWLTYRLLERPIRHKTPSKVSLWLLVSMCFLGLAGYLIHSTNGLPSRAVAQKYSFTNYTEEIAGYVPCNLRKDPIDPNLAKSDINYCVVSANTFPSKAIIGDSHAEDKFHGLVDLDKNHNWILLGNSNCPPVTTISFSGDQMNCARQFESIYQYLETNKNITEVVLSFYGIYFRKNNYLSSQVQSPLRSATYLNTDWGWQAMFYASLDAAIKRLLHAGKKMVILIDVPELQHHPKDCIRNSFKKCNVTASEVINIQTDMRNMIAQLKADNPGLEVYDSLNSLCQDGTCSFMSGNTVLYRDSNHLSLAGSQIYAKQFLMRK
jgi:peptidoglycan/LPS O-acetylase OafA/YrhL